MPLNQQPTDPTEDKKGKNKENKENKERTEKQISLERISQYMDNAAALDTEIDKLVKETLIDENAKKRFWNWLKFLSRYTITIVSAMQILNQMKELIPSKKNLLSSLMALSQMTFISQSQWSSLHQLIDKAQKKIEAKGWIDRCTEIDCDKIFEEICNE